VGLQRRCGSSARAGKYARRAPEPSDLQNDSYYPNLVCMESKIPGNPQCPIVRSLERVGEWWNILIIRDAVYGLKRFDEFQKSLDIAPNMLTKRLNGLVDDGILERRRYSDKPPRCEYVLTEKGRDFRPVLVALLAWGNKHFAPEGPSVLFADKETGAIADPVVVDRVSGRRIPGGGFALVPGPAAGERMRQRLARAAETAAQKTGAMYE